MKNIKNSPIRDLEMFPVSAAKIAALTESMEKTGYWGNILARINEEGEIEIVDGQARLEALRLLHKNEPDFGVELLVAELTFSQMIQTSARLNDEVYKTTGVRNLVHDVFMAKDKFADADIAKLLGKPAPHVVIALEALTLIQAGTLTWDSLDELTILELAELVGRLKREQLERALREIRKSPQGG